MSRLRRVSLISLPLLLVSQGCGQDWDALEPRPPVGPEGQWEMTFDEECSGTIVDSKKWNRRFVAPDRKTFFDRYDWSGSSVEENNVVLGDGLCKIIAENRPSGDARYTTGVLDSTNLFEQELGYFEIRARATAGVGFVSNINIASATRWPPQINVLAVDGQDPRHHRFTTYFRINPADSADFAASDTTEADLTTAFHIYGVQWKSDRILTFFDGKPTGELSRAAPYIQEPLRWQATLHVATDYVPAPDASTPFPGILEIDYFRAYRQR